MRPPHALAVGSLLLVGVTAALLAGPAVAADPVEATNGTTYDHGTTIAIDVSTNGSYALRNADGAFVAQYSAANGTVVVDTGDLRNGDYTLRDDAGATAFAFGVDGAPTTTTTTTASTSDDTDGETVALDDGATYDAGVTLTRDVTGEEYVLRTGDGAFVRQLVASDGAVAFDTDGFDGGYRLLDAEGDVVVTFSVDGADDTTTTTTTTTTESEESPDAEADAPLDRTVEAEDGGVYWRGVALRVDATGDATLRTGDGAFVAQYAPADGRVTVDTARLDAGDYRLNAAENVTFSVARQTLDATAAEGTLTIASNRAGYPLVLRSDALTTADLHALVPASEVRDGRVLVTDAGADATLDLDLDSAALPSGTYSITAVGGDTGVRDAATVTLAASEPASGEANSTATTPAENGADDANETTHTTNASTTTHTTTTRTTTEVHVDTGTTSGDTPGFGLVVGGVALAGAALLARRT